jgi:hypothetical protein
MVCMAVANHGEPSLIAETGPLEAMAMSRTAPSRTAQAIHKVRRSPAMVRKRDDMDAIGKAHKDDVIRERMNRHLTHIVIINP